MTEHMTIEPGTRYGFFTDTSVCIGCKACEVACHAWNGIESEVAERTGDSAANTAALTATPRRACTVPAEIGARSRGRVHACGRQDGRHGQVRGCR